MANDARNVDITQKIFDVLNNVKGFTVGTGNPYKGKIIANYKDTNFVISITPIYNEGHDVSFEEAFKANSYILDDHD